MHHRSATAPRGDGAAAGEKRGLSEAAFVGSYAAADFRLQPRLPEVAFIGRSNVGKSSLINALVSRRTLAHTSKTPGKTRTCNVYNVEDRYYLVDLPGYGYARLSHTERRRLLDLVTAYLETREPLIGVVWLLDVRRDLSEDDIAVGRRLVTRSVPVLVAVTKADKLPRSRRAARLKELVQTIEVPEDQCLLTSARTREGIADLRDSIDALASRAREP